MPFDGKPIEKPEESTGHALASISIESNKEDRQGIIEVVFNTTDKTMLSWVASTFWDGKLSTDEDGKVRLIPNAEYYQCPRCNRILSSAIGIPSLYQECRGNKDDPHDLLLTLPMDWHPLLSRTGVSFLVGQLQANINPNIQTGNMGKSTVDVENRADLDSKLARIAVKTSEAIVASMLSNKDNYAPWMLMDKTYAILPQVFNVPFLTGIMNELSMNLLSSYTKGKYMTAVSKIVENRAHIEQEIMNRSERSAVEQALSQSGGSLGGIGSIFHLGNPQNK